MPNLYLDTMTLKGTPLADKLHVAAAVGYPGVRIRGNDVKEFAASGGSATALGNLLRQMGLSSPAFVTEAEVYDWHYLDTSDPRSQQRMEEAISTAIAVGARCALFPVMQTEGTLERLLENFIWLCGLGERYDLLIGLEFIGHVPKVPDIATAWQIVRRANHPFGGVVVDLFHYYRGGSRFEDLLAVPGDRIFVVDVDDAMDLPRAELLGYKHRLYPGQGVIPVRQVLGALQQKGFAGPYCIELFNEAYWAADPLLVAQTAWQQTTTVMREAVWP